MNEQITLSTPEEIKIISDPFRLSILKEYMKLNRPATVKQIADRMHETPAKVHYHIKKFLSIDLLELDHIEEINGINAKFYRLKYKSIKIDRESNDDLIDDILGDTENLLLQIINDFKRDFINLMKENTDKEGRLSYSVVHLTDEQKERFTDLLDEIYSNNSKTENTNPYLLFSALMPEKNED